MPGKLAQFDYPRHFQVRRVSGNNSCIRFKNRFVFVSRALGGEYIGLEQKGDRVYNLYFCELLIGRFKEEKLRIEDIIERLPLRQIYNRPGSHAFHAPPAIPRVGPGHRNRAPPPAGCFPLSNTARDSYCHYIEHYFYCHKLQNTE